MIGAPYAVAGVTYTPEDTLNYDAVGYAGWYGEELQGNKTANGETFMPMAITAAHKTLPLPSYVEVTRSIPAKRYWCASMIAGLLRMIV
nr:RlpA-like double-psi beta-barrel domain-containing protein [Sphingobium sp. Ant17]